MKKRNCITILIIFILFCGFATAQKENQNKPWFFIQITDPQFGMFEENVDFVQETILYEKAIARVNRLKPDFVVITGDFVNDSKSDSQVNEFKRITAEINPDIKVYYTPGNHDIGQNPTKKSLELYKTNYGDDKFSFTHKGSYFLGINTSFIKANKKHSEKKQYKWLLKELEKTGKTKQIIVFCHYPFFIHNFYEPETYSNLSLESRKNYLSLFEAYKVDAVFSGHYHNNVINSYHGIQLVTTSAVGKPLGDAPSGIRIIKVFADRIEHEYFGLEDIPDSIDFY